MRFKLDENTPRLVQQAWQAAGHDVHTVYDESLEGASDSRLLAACVGERRVLVTFDLDIADLPRVSGGRARPRPGLAAGAADFRRSAPAGRRRASPERE